MNKEILDFLAPNYYEGLEVFVEGILSGELPLEEEGLLHMVKYVQLADPTQKSYFVKRVITALIRPYWEEFMRVNGPKNLTISSIQTLLTLPDYLERKIQ